MRVLFCSDGFPAASQLLRERLAGHPEDEVLVRAGSAVREAARHADVLVPAMGVVDGPVMDASAGRVRLIQQWGTGLDGVDFEAARSRGIPVANVSASANAESVAEHAVLLMLAVLRQLPLAESNVRSGVLGAPVGRTLAGRTVCLYGLGQIARALAKRLRPFGVRLVGLTREPSATKCAELRLDECYAVADREKCLARTDVLVLCLPLVPATRGVIDSAVLAALPEGAILINVARGGLVDYGALTAALRSGRLAGAGLDVYWQEPIAPDDPLLALPNVVTTPHVAGVTDRSYGEICDAVVTNIDRVRRGEPPLNRVV